MQTIHVSPDFPLNRRMRKAVRRGKLQVVREGGEQFTLGADNGEKFKALCREARECTLCPNFRIEHGSSVLSSKCGPITASLMFVGEAPGRLGAHITRIPFHGDQTGDNFEKLLKSAGIAREDAFITNAVLCNPKKSGNNAKPTRDEIGNCGQFLKRQIELVNPKVVATLGKVALKALARIERHSFKLKASIGTAQKWHGRLLVPMYHPSQQVINIHRDFPEQKEDYRFLFEVWEKVCEGN